MSNEKSKREQAHERTESLLGKAMNDDLWSEGYQDARTLVDLIIDAAKEELRAEMDSLDEEILREMHRRHGKPPTGDGEDRPPTVWVRELPPPPVADGEADS